MNFDPKTDGMATLLVGMIDGPAAAGKEIVASEKRGQAELVARAKGKEAQLPCDISRESRAVLEAAGVKFLGPAGNDPLFQRAELPAGWKVEPTQHSMWSRLIDDKGRRRATIFYKAAFYDRRAHMNVKPRYEIEGYFNDDHETFAAARVLDADGSVVFESERIKITEENKHTKYDPGTGKPIVLSANGRAAESCEAWLNANHPDWKSLTAYWD